MEEIFGALLHGGGVVVPEEVVGSPEDFRALLVGENVTVLTQTPSAAAVLSPEGLESVALLMAGEPCRWSWCSVGRRAGDDQRLRPTETTVCASRTASLRAGSGAPPIGSPVAGAAFFVLDSWLRPVPLVWPASCI
ncbi:AMP-binding enzyme family protein [Mycobacterium xenopi 4042]|uniref:AMP-binding enzyme family protein n=1 Tax=Mycobacterium xenopi 4042 TaxID=1299334 RepID=X8DD82_MYCXE|nr:AMP-binding enzyme family protein [Mycobacterium xenopi 4042]